MARACTSPPLSAAPWTCSLATQSTGALAQASNGTGCIVAAALPGCTTGTQISGADAVAVSPEDGEVYVTSVLSNSADHVHPHANYGATDPAGGYLGLRDLPAGGGLLARPGARRSRGAGRLPRRRQRLCDRVRLGRDRRLQSQQPVGRPDPEATPRGLPDQRASPRTVRSRAGCSGSARSQSAPTAGTSTRRAFASNAVGVFRRDHSACVARQMTRKEIEDGQTQDRPRDGWRDHSWRAAEERCRRRAWTHARRAGGSRSRPWDDPRRAPASPAAPVAGMNVLALPDRPATRGPALPAGLDRAQHARPHPPAGARPDVRERVHERLHVLAGALDADVRLLPRPARRQVHAGDRHARPGIPSGRTGDELQEPRDASPPPPATHRSTRASFTASSRPTAPPGCPRTSTSTGSPAGTHRTRAPIRTSPRRAAGSTTTTGAS